MARSASQRHFGSGRATWAIEKTELRKRTFEHDSIAEDPSSGSGSPGKSPERGSGDSLGHHASLVGLLGGIEDDKLDYLV